MVRRTLIFLIICFVSTFNSQSQSLKSILKSQTEISPNLSIYVKNLSKNKKIISYQDQKKMVPASNQKIVTTIAALQFLGPNYRFKTSFFLTGKIQKNGINYGNMYVDTKGDPTLSSSKLKKIIKFYKNQGIKEIKGNIIINSNYYEKPYYNSTWKKSWKGLSWAPYISSIAINNNLYNSGDNIYLTDNPLYLLGIIIKRELNKANILFNGKVIIKKISFLDKINPFKIKQHIYSDELSKIITVINKDSNNLYAENLFKKLSANYLRDEGSWRNSQKIVRFLLNKKVGIKNSSFNIEDGSGLSPFNTISTHGMVKLLEFASKESYFNDFYDSLPIGGKDGTLNKRFKTKPLYLNIRAKTGYIKGVSSLSGYIVGKNNDLYAFSIIVNNHNYSIRDFMERILTAVYYL